MVNQSSLDRAYMDCAFALSKLSRAQRKKVGAVIVLPDGLILPGFNGTPSGFDNCCELEDITCVHDWQKKVLASMPGFYCTHCNREQPPMANLPTFSVELITKPEVLHAESNAIAKAAGSTVSLRGGTLYITSSPCLGCSKMIIQSGIVRVVYDEKYRLTDGIDLLRLAGIEIHHLERG